MKYSECEIPSSWSASALAKDHADIYTRTHSAFYTRPNAARIPLALPRFVSTGTPV